MLYNVHKALASLNATSKVLDTAYTGGKDIGTDQHHI